MKRALGGLMLNARRAIADTCTHHHHHHHHHTYHYNHSHHYQYDGSCISSAFPHVLSSIEPIQDPSTHDDIHMLHQYHHDQPHIPPASEQAALGLHQQHHHFNLPHQPMFSLSGSLRQGISRTRGCNTSAFTVRPCQTPKDAHVVPLETSASMKPLAPSTLREPIQHASVNDAKRAEHLSHDATQSDLSSHETRKLLNLIKVEELKKRLLTTGRHCMSLEEVLNVCKETGTAMSDAEAAEIVKALDQAGIILIFRRKVFLEPEKVANALSKAMPLPLALEEDPRNQEYARLQKEKEEIDQIAHKQVRNMLWGALVALSAQSMLFFRLTFWELSWDVMEPIAFFVTSSSLLAGFFFFVITKRDPSYHDFMDTLFSSKQRKLIKKRNFDMKRFKELQLICCLPSTESSSKQPRIGYAYG